MKELLYTFVVSTNVDIDYNHTK